MILTDIETGVSVWSLTQFSLTKASCSESACLFLAGVGFSDLSANATLLLTAFPALAPGVPLCGGGRQICDTH